MQVHALASRRARATVAVRAAIYARVSSDQQAERHTIDSQVEALLARAAADGHEVTAELRFLDDGHSGASLIRPALERLRDMAALAASLGLEVHAGHGITFETVAPIAAILEVVELNIGHFLIGEAVFTGLGPAIARMRAAMDAARA